MNQVASTGAARRCARSLSLTLTGTLAVVLLAKQHGLIDSAARVMHALRDANFRLDDHIIREALMRCAGYLLIRQPFEKSKREFRQPRHGFYAPLYVQRLIRY